MVNPEYSRPRWSGAPEHVKSHTSMWMTRSQKSTAPESTAFTKNIKLPFLDLRACGRKFILYIVKYKANFATSENKMLSNLDPTQLSW